MWTFYTGGDGRYNLGNGAPSTTSKGLHNLGRHGRKRRLAMQASMCVSWARFRGQWNHAWWRLDGPTCHNALISKRVSIWQSSRKDHTLESLETILCAPCCTCACSCDIYMHSQDRICLQVDAIVKWIWSKDWIIKCDHKCYHKCYHSASDQARSGSETWWLIVYLDMHRSTLISIYVGVRGSETLGLFGIFSRI